MHVVSSEEGIADLKNNQIIGNFSFVNSKIIFHGKGNILISNNTESSQKCVLKNTTITFNNDNSVAFLNMSPTVYSIDILLFNSNICFIGANTRFNGMLTLQCSEHCNIFIGNDCLFSFDIWLRTSDVHLIYDVSNHKRINMSKSIFIGDHVWVGQEAKIWKGTHIGSGAIIGAETFVTGKRIPSNTAWGGNPARCLKTGVFWYDESSHPFTKADTEKWSTFNEDTYNYTFDENATLDFLELEHTIFLYRTAQERASFLLSFNRRQSKNRFCILPQPFTSKVITLKNRFKKLF